MEREGFQVSSEFRRKAIRYAKFALWTSVIATVVLADYGYTKSAILAAFAAWRFGAIIDAEQIVISIQEKLIAKRY